VRSVIHQMNHIMRPLKGYVEQGVADKSVMRLVEVLNKLDDSELRLIMAKYVKLAKSVSGARQVKLPLKTDVLKHLGMKLDDYEAIERGTANRVNKLYYDTYKKELKQADEGFEKMVDEIQQERELWRELIGQD
jgi:uncharacterized protein YdcH (DUF465 family)